MSTEKNDKELSVGGRLRLERKRIGLTQEELAAAVGVHTRTQANYELNKGRSGPGMAYFEALRKTGIDVPYVQTGVKTGPRLDLERAAERLFMAFSEALQIPIDRAHAAITNSADVASSEVQQQAQWLLNESPLLAARHKVLKLDRDLLVDILEGVEVELRKNDKAATPLRKAHTVARLYEMFSLRGEVDKAMLESAVKSMPSIPL